MTFAGSPCHPGWRRLFATGFLCALSTPLLAGTAGEIFGSVSDVDSRRIANVAVVAAGPNLQGARSTVTNDFGDYRFPLLPPGAYRLEFQLAGFQSVVQDDVLVSLDSKTRLDVALQPASASESVAVHGDAIAIDPTKATLQQNYKEDFVQHAAVGLQGRTFTNLLLEIPGVTLGGFVLGAHPSQNVFLTDGLNVTEPINHNFPPNIPFDAIQEIAGQTGGFEAEYGKAVGGVSSLITKSGGNELRGTADVRYTSDRLSERGRQRQQYPPGTTALRFDRDMQNFQNLRPAATLGGPVLQDRVWFFVAAERIDDRDQPPNILGFEPGQQRTGGWNLFGKLTATPAANHSLAVKYENAFDSIPFTDDVSSVRPEAATDQSDRTENLGVFGDSVFSERLFGDLKAGILRTKLDLSPHSGNEALTESLDRNSGVSSVNAATVVHQKTERGELTGSASLSPDAAGRHLVKAGADFDWTRFDQQARPTGTPLDPAMCSTAYGQPAGARCGALATTQDGAPYRFDVYTILPDATFHGQARSFFLQDEWRPLSSLTIRIGARYDNVGYFLDDGTKAKALTRIQPRLGIAWDPGRSGQTLIHFQAGDFMDENGLRLTSFLDRRGAVDSAFLWDPTSGQYVPYFHQGGPSGNSLDPALKPTHSTEVSLGVTRRIAANTVADVSAVWRKSYDLWEDSCRGGDCRLPDSSLWMTNQPDGQDVLRSQYRGILLKIESRPTDRLHLVFSYVWSRTQGSVADYNQGEDFDYFPDNYVNRYGYLPGEARNRVKLDGFVRLPAQFLLASHVYWDSGRPYSVAAPSNVSGLIFLESRGSRRLPHFSQWDLQIQKDLQLGPLRASLIATVYNVLDTEIPLARFGNVGASGTIERPTNPLFNLDAGWQQPRHYEAGVRIEF
jgi:hypothetical protein